MGKKYIIEIPEDKITDFVGSTHFLMPYIMAGHIGHHDTGLPIEPYTEPDFEKVRKEAYDKGFEDGKELCPDPAICYNNAYQKGLSDAWEAARKILFNPDDGGMSAIDVNEVFGESSWTVMKDFSASEVVAKIKEYEDSKQKIKVGDEVEDGVANLVVLEINEDGTVEGFTNYGSVVHAIPRKKTGRYFPEVVALLKNMKGK